MTGASLKKIAERAGVSVAIVSNVVNGYRPVKATRERAQRAIADDLLGPEGPEERTERDEAATWLVDYLTAQGPTKSTDVKKAARVAGHTEIILRRAPVAVRHCGIGRIPAADLLDAVPVRSVRSQPG